MAELHPPIVHFAIALTIIGVVFDLLGFALKKESLKHAGFWTFIVGVVAVWGAMLSGEAAEEAVEKFIEGTNVEKVFEPHEELGKFIGLIGYQGRLGGKMVYEYGVGIKPLMDKIPVDKGYEEDED